MNMTYIAVPVCVCYVEHKLKTAIKTINTHRKSPLKSERNTFSCKFWYVPGQVGAMSVLTHIFNLNIGINL